MQFVHQFHRQRREIIDEIERIFDLVRNAGGELTERSKLFCLNQAILRGAQIIERPGKFLGSLLHLFEHPHIADGDYCLVGKGL